MQHVNSQFRQERQRTKIQNPSYEMTTSTTTCRALKPRARPLRATPADIELTARVDALPDGGNVEINKTEMKNERVLGQGCPRLTHHGERKGGTALSYKYSKARAGGGHQQCARDRARARAFLEMGSAKSKVGTSSHAYNINTDEDREILDCCRTHQSRLHVKVAYRCRRSPRPGCRRRRRY